MFVSQDQPPQPVEGYWCTEEQCAQVMRQSVEDLRRSRNWTRPVGPPHVVVEGRYWYSARALYLYLLNIGLPMPADFAEYWSSRVGWTTDGRADSGAAPCPNALANAYD